MVPDSSVGESDKLGCRLDVKPLSSDYRALLYPCGGECDTVPMPVDGLQFEVTRNLAMPVRHIRYLMVTNEKLFSGLMQSVSTGERHRKGSSAQINA